MLGIGAFRTSSYTDLSAPPLAGLRLDETVLGIQCPHIRRTSLACSVLDLGATPGGWSEVAAGLVGVQGRVIAVDLKDMVPLKDVTFLRGDFTEASTQEALLRGLEPANQFDVLLSDMAPDFSGDQQTDHLRSMNLCYEVS